MDGTISAQDASDMAAAMRLGDGNADQVGRKSGGGGVNSRSRVRVATGEKAAETVPPVNLTVFGIKLERVSVVIEAC